MISFVRAISWIFVGVLRLDYGSPISLRVFKHRIANGFIFRKRIYNKALYQAKLVRMIDIDRESLREGRHG